MLQVNGGVEIPPPREGAPTDALSRAIAATLPDAEAVGDVPAKRVVKGRGAARYVGLGGDDETGLQTMRSIAGNNWVEQDAERLAYRRSRSRSRNFRRPGVVPSKPWDRWKEMNVDNSRERRKSRSRERKEKSRSRRKKKSRSRSRKKDSKNGKKSRSRSRKKERSKSRKKGCSKSRSKKRSRKRSKSKRRRKSRSTSKSKARNGKSSKRGKKRSRSSSSSSSGSSSKAEKATAKTAGADAEVKEFELFKPYSRVLLRNLVKNYELNAQAGVIVPSSCAQSPEVPGCLKVRLESGREVAVKPGNLQLVQAAPDEKSEPDGVVA